MVRVGGGVVAAGFATLVNASEVKPAAALWLNVSMPFLLPTDVGVRTMINVQCAIGNSVMPIWQLLAAMLNSLSDAIGSSDTRKSFSTSGALPVFVIVTLVPGDAEPTCVDGSAKAALLTSAIGAALAGSTPTPVSAIVVTAGVAL